MLVGLLQGRLKVLEFALQQPQLATLSDAGWNTLAAAKAAIVDALVTIGANKKERQKLLKALSRADADADAGQRDGGERSVRRRSAAEVAAQEAELNASLARRRCSLPTTTSGEIRAALKVTLRQPREHARVCACCLLLAEYSLLRNTVRSPRVPVAYC